MPTRVLRWSPFLLVAILSPALLHLGNCGDPHLDGLEVEADSLNRVVGFSKQTHQYNIWTDGADTIVVSARTTEASAGVDCRLFIDGVFEDFQPLGTGGGEIALTIPPDTPSEVQLDVNHNGQIGRYTLNINPPCSADECDDANPCTIDACTGNTCDFTSLPGCTTDCGNGVIDPGEECDDGNNVDGDGCSAGCLLELDPDPVTKSISMVCSQNVTLDVSTFDYELTVDPLAPLVSGTPVDLALSGDALFDATDGVMELGVLGLNATVAVRSGGSAPDVLLSHAQPFSNGRCLVTNTPCSVDADCSGSESCVDYIPVPTLDGTSDGCAACTAIGEGPACAMFGFCSDGPAVVSLGTAQMVATPDSSGTLLVGWDDDALPPVAVPPETLGPNGALFWISGPIGGAVFLRTECAMGTADGSGTAGVALPDSELIALPVAP